MKGYYDINIRNVSVVVKKKENHSFSYKCEGRNQDGFILITGGNGVFENSEQMIKLRKNSLLIVSRGEKYTISALDDDFEYITTAFEIAPDDAFNIIGLPKVIDIGVHIYLIKQFNWLLSIWQERSSLYVLKTRVQLEQIIIDLFNINTASEGKVTNRNVIQPAINYINRFYDREISVSELAELCKLSVSHFRRVFKEKTGYTPMRYRESVRIHWAKQLIISNLFTVSEIAFKLGYYDVYHFSKDFKKYTSVSPKQYLQEHKLHLSAKWQVKTG